MKSDVVQRKTPEEEELDSKLAELAELEVVLAQRELDFATLQAELNSFENRYLRAVGTLYAGLDEIEAEIAEHLARLEPGDEAVQARATKARAQANQSASATGGPDVFAGKIEFKPSEDLKKLYRQVAKAIHPDLATDPEERERRQHLMAEANRAYEEGDEARLRAILDEWEMGPESVKGEGIATELVRAVRKIAQVRVRLQDLEAEMARLEQSDLYELKARAEEARAEGRDLLAEMAEKVEEQISRSRVRLQAVLDEEARR